MSKEQLKALESEVNAQLLEMAASNAGLKHFPITDGVVDIDQFLSSSPKILWILKEPWEKLKDGEIGGNWSLTSYLKEDGKIGNKGSWARMAYVTYSVFNNYLKYEDIPYVTKDPKVGPSLKKIVYINVKKFPGQSTSVRSEIEFYYNRYRGLLKKQITTINPDVIIFGNILSLFLNDLDLKIEDFKSEGSVEVCRKKARLYINAYHPSYWRISGEKYVDDIVAVIRQSSW